MPAYNECRSYTLALRAACILCPDGTAQRHLLTTCTGDGAVISIYCYLGALGEAPAALATRLLGMDIAPFFDCPYLASSLSSFWRRWNVTAADSLRFIIYEPILEGGLLGFALNFKPYRSNGCLSVANIVQARLIVLKPTLLGWSVHVISWCFVAHARLSG